MYDADINPRFRVMNPQAPDPQLDEFRAQHEKNKRRPGRKGHVEPPFFDPNKHPSRLCTYQAETREVVCPIILFY
jgi:hypothetical protein